MAHASTERRAHKRHDLACPARLVDEAGSFIASGKTLNISDGGMLLAVRPEDAAAPGARADVKLSVPRSTPNTYLMQPFNTPAIVVRFEKEPEGPSRVAVQFATPLDLDLEL